MTLQLTEDQISWIASEIQDHDELLHKPIIQALENLGADPLLAQDPEFLEKLQDTMFVCDECEKWRNKEVRVYNKILGMKCCEECDDNNQE